ncbi:MAG: YqgE/AlgH family protein [Solirubrobacterales bacterium]|jgi:putative transcriptional regulator|nr:YqgE/AlgH family protein [Solirubrobacterales bacterium]
MAESLRGKLLIAAPNLFDYFRRSVVLVVEHTEQGAFGVVLNRRAGSEVAELVPDLGPLVERGAPLWLGGPVGPDSVVVLGEFEHAGRSAGVVTEKIGVVDPDGDTEVLRARVFIGHAGWGAGQLDEELERDSWIVGDLDPDDVFAEGDLWAEVVSRRGGDYALLATMPEDPTRN